MNEEIFDVVAAPRGCTILEVLRYRSMSEVDRASSFSTSLLQKIHVIYCLQIQDMSDSKLIRTDIILDLSQKAEKHFFLVQF